MVEVTKHSFVPEHVKLNEKEMNELFKKYNILLKQLPKISSKDPAIQELEPERGDIIKIKRISETNKEAVFFRVVINE